MSEELIVALAYLEELPEISNENSHFAVPGDVALFF